MLRHLVLRTRLRAGSVWAWPLQSCGVEFSRGQSSAAQVSYLVDPVRWQSDPDVAACGDALSRREENPQALLRAAATLQQRLDLPSDLRASAGRAQAGELLRHAATLAKALRIDPSKPWPSTHHEHLVAAAKEASMLYAVAGSVDPLDSGSVAGAALEAQKFLLEVHLLEIRWLMPQVQRARAVAHAERSGSLPQSDVAVQQLSAAGLSSNASEEELLRRAVARAEAAEAGVAEAPALKKQLQVTLAGLMSDLSLACACIDKSCEAAKQMIRALCLAADGGLGKEEAERMSETAQAVWEHCTKSVKHLSPEATGEALRLSTELGAAILHFNSKQ
mmetsp:Transcript_96952/g.172567  ORF Transcript_96952/g.172567 Transcript_96952/m.172567 type:complete len:334 (-) Transcript_96952:14-1015(-)